MPVVFQDGGDLLHPGTVAPDGSRRSNRHLRPGPAELPVSIVLSLPVQCCHGHSGLGVFARRVDRTSLVPSPDTVGERSDATVECISTDVFCRFGPTA